MPGVITQFFGNDAYIPHGLCLAWEPAVLGLHVSSDVLIGLSYYSIPLALVHFVRRRRDVAFSWVLWLFAVFIMACGTTHLFSVWTLWNPDYGVEAVVKGVTAAVSMLTAVSLWMLMPQFLALPSPRQLEDVNRALQSEIAERRAAEERWSGLFSNAAEALFVVTVRPDGRFAFDTINPAHARATGFEPALIAGRTVDEALAPGLAAHMAERYAACVAAGAPIDYEEEMDLPGGRRTWHTVLAPLRDSSGRIVQLLGSARDVTERARLRAELAQASKLATLGTLAAGIAHELSQPLNVIRLWAENGLSRLREGALDGARLERLLALVSDQAERMGRIIDHMRPFSRSGDGADAFDPRAAVLAAADIVRHQYALENVTVEVDADEDLGHVRGRPVQLEQVLVNLFSNARDAILAHKAGGGRIAVTARRDDARGVLRVTVEDDGGGVPAHVLPNIFDPFFTTKEVGKGTGLGLSIAYGIIDAMGGRLEAANVPGGRSGAAVGARFTVTLPLAPPPPGAPTHRHDQEAADG